MATAAFLGLHLAALLFFMPALFVTVPAHIIYGVMRRDSGPPGTHIECPACRELVHREASVCGNCRQALEPESARIASQHAARLAVRAGKPWHTRWLY